MRARGLAISWVSSVIRTVALTSLILASSASSAAPLQPTGKWVLNYEDAQCVAYRNYGTEKDPLYLAFKAPPVGSVVQMMVLNKGPRSDPTQEDATVKIGDRAQMKTNMLVYRNQDGARYRSRLINLPLAEFDAFSKTPSVDIVSAGSNYSFAVPDFGPLKKALDECLADLRAFWNVPELGKTGSLLQDPSGDLARVFSPEDYPRMALLGGMQGMTAVALLIDEKGKVADCSVVETSGTAAIDAQSCAIIRGRARLNPALGADGKPAKSGWVQRILWRLER